MEWVGRSNRVEERNWSISNFIFKKIWNFWLFLRIFAGGIRESVFRISGARMLIFTRFLDNGEGTLESLRLLSSSFWSLPFFTVTHWWWLWFQWCLHKDSIFYFTVAVFPWRFENPDHLEISDIFLWRKKTKNWQFFADARNWAFYENNLRFLSEKWNEDGVGLNASPSGGIWRCCTLFVVFISCVCTYNLRLLDAALCSLCKSPFLLGFSVENDLKRGDLAEAVC
jgi:hypothetical protein